MRGEISDSAIASAVAQLEGLKGPGVFRTGRHGGYTCDPLLNLIDGVNKDDFWADLSSGDGSELENTPQGPAKFCAAHSSSALCVNVFGPFRRAPQHLVLNGVRGFTDTQFERKCSTGLGGKFPNLDFFAQGDECVIGVESKFLEILSSKRAKFSDAYEAPMSKAGTRWRDVYSPLKADPGRFSMLDAAQLVKHHLGLLHTFGQQFKRIALVYVYWEPSNVTDFPEYQGHRREVADFSGLVAGDTVKFRALSYPDLWEEWERDSSWPGMAGHLRAVRVRYSCPVAEDPGAA